MIDTKKVFLASSEELAADRAAFELAIGRQNKDWVRRGVFVEVVLWEDFLDALAPGGLQEEYNRAIAGCDLFVMLYWTKVGKYTEQEFDVAIGQFQESRKPYVFTYYKDAPPPEGVAVEPSLEAFQARLKALGHYQTRYPNAEGLLLHFAGQLDKSVARPSPRQWPIGAVCRPLGESPAGRRRRRRNGPGQVKAGTGSWAAEPG